MFRLSAKDRNFRLFCPDETSSNKLQNVFDATLRAFELPIIPTDEFLAPDGRVMEILSEHCCEGWLEGYLLTGRHGVFACYEAFISIVDSMMAQYAKWSKMAREIPWRVPVASLNYLLTSHIWEQDHNGYSHQGPTFINMLLTKKASMTRVYLPPDTNCLLSVTDHALRSRGHINLIVASKKAIPQWLDPGGRARALRAGRVDLGLGEQRRREPRRGHGRGRRRTDPRDPRRRLVAPARGPRPPRTGRERGRSPVARFAG